MEIEELPEVDKDARCCLNCEFYEERTGFCRFNPPLPQKVYIQDANFMTSMFPRISCPNLDWCGQFQNKND